MMVQANPFKILRNSVGLTIEDVCRLAGVSKSYVIKNEHGGYSEPSETLIQFYRRRIEPFSESTFRAQYRMWQKETRHSNFGVLLPYFPLKSYLAGLPVGASLSTQALHPLVYWRECSAKKPNLNTVSKAFCLHQGLLYKFEQQSHLVNSVPEPFANALMDAGYSRTTLNDFSLAFTEYRQYVRNINLRVQNSGFIRSPDSTAELL